jgi:hypothetical protein
MFCFWVTCLLLCLVFVNSSSHAESGWKTAQYKWGDAGLGTRIRSGAVYM